ncbi:MAG: hypothetical protein ACLP0J_25295 [Solirubrobacteraceae bacterium]
MIEPDLSADTLAEELRLRKATPEEFAAFLAEHEHEMLPPDCEG